MLLEEKDLKVFKDAIREVVKEEIKHLFKEIPTGDNEKVFTVSDLAEYLKVEESWIYKQVSLRAIPFFKLGKYVRFRKSEIDRWITKHSRTPIAEVKLPSKIRAYN